MVAELVPWSCAGVVVVGRACPPTLGRAPASLAERWPLAVRQASVFRVDKRNTDVDRPGDDELAALECDGAAGGRPVGVALAVFFYSCAETRTACWRWNGRWRTARCAACVSRHCVALPPVPGCFQRALLPALCVVW